MSATLEFRRMAAGGEGLNCLPSQDILPRIVPRPSPEDRVLDEQNLENRKRFHSPSGKEVTMKSHVHNLKIFLGFGLIALICLAASLPAAAKDNPADHPLRILKARYQNDTNRGSGMSARGNLTVWLQNSADATVDGVEIEVELYNDRGRKVETLRKKVEDLGPGEKKVVTFRWDVVAENNVKPRFYVEYNRRGTQKARFEGESPNWQ